MSVGAVIACITFAAIGPLCRKFEERSVLLWGGFLLMAIGRILYIPYGDQLPLIATNSSIVDLNLNSLNVSMDGLTAMNDNTTLNIEVVGCPLSQKW